MKVLLINGSPKKAGCTFTALNEVAKSLNEKPIVNVANALNDGFDPKYISFIDGTCYLADSLDEE